jgi:hypothetical protein
MFEFLGMGSMKNPEAAMNAYQQEGLMTSEQAAAARLNNQVQTIQKIVDALCEVYVAQHAKEIADRPYATQFYVTDQPIIDRAKLLELQRTIKVAEMELKELKRGARI